MSLPEWSEAQKNDTFNRAAYGRMSDRYAVHRPRYPKELFEQILSHVDRRDLAIDCATGTGQAAIELSTRFTKSPRLRRLDRPNKPPAKGAQPLRLRRPFRGRSGPER